MPSRCNVWSRIAYVLDALSLMKLAAAAVFFVLFEGSPLFALGIVFAAPVIAACSALIARLLRHAATGRRLDYNVLHARRQWLGESEMPRRRTLADRYVDVTPIKYRRVRTSAPRQAESAILRARNG